MSVDFIDLKKVKKDSNGIWVTRLKLDKDVALSKKTWEKIYNYNIRDLIKDKSDFKKNKLKYHLRYIESAYNFNSKTTYLEIGSGPAHMGEYFMKKYGCTFIGVDFNYTILLTLKKYFESKGYKNFTLIHADINSMPLKSNSIDFIYGGGVIEHFSDTNHILAESYRLLKKDGVTFNTVPAFNFWWLTRFYNNIPSPFFLKKLFEFIHLSCLKGKILEKYYGYELSYLPFQLRKLHKNLQFKNIQVGAFAFYPSRKALNNDFLRKVYYLVSSFALTCPIYYVKAQK